MEKVIDLTDISNKAVDFTNCKESDPSDRTEICLMVIVLIGIFIWRTFLSINANLIPDECSYWAWSRRLDWSYFDNSGMVAYLIRLSTEIFGRSTPFTVRFPFLMSSFITTLLVYSTARLLSRSTQVGVLSALLFNLAPISLLGATAAVHDNALIMFWALALWSCARFLESEDPRCFYFIGTAAGLAIISKYTGVLLFPAILIWLLSSKKLRQVLLRKEPWLGVFIAFLFTLPILWWNYQHDWASFKHILFIGSGYHGFFRRLSGGLGYNLAQFLTVSPLFYTAMAVGILFSMFLELRREDNKRSLLLCMGLPIFLFSVMSLKGHSEANWGVMGYISTGILAIMLFSDNKSPVTLFFGKLINMRRYVIIGASLSIIIVGLVVVHGWLGLLPAAVERNLGKDDRIIWETLGWRGLGQHVVALKKDEDVIAADTYQLCALLEFNIPGQPEVRYVAPWDRPTQFDVWNTSYDDLKDKNILFVSSKPLGPTNNTLTTIYENFSHVEQLPYYPIIYHEEQIRQVYICRGYVFDPFKPRRLGPKSLFYADY